MKKLKKILRIACALSLAAVLTACAKGANDNISLVSREEGSGTRSAFVSIFGVEEKDASGQNVDHTADAAEITNSTSVMLSTVAGNPNAIGYVSLGSLNDTVKALPIDGVEATVENVKNGSYKAARPFNIVTGANVSPLAADFIAFIQSAQGQAVVEESHYVSEGNTGDYAASATSGKLVIAGSSSVTPVMEKLKEAYVALHTNVEIEIQQSDSTTGVNSALEGVCDIGMASRALKDSELSAGLSATVIALDGIAVIVSPDNACTALTSTQVKSLFTGETAQWSALA